MDVNGDGLPDAVSVRRKAKVDYPGTGTPTELAGEPLVAINTGNGFAAYTGRPLGQPPLAKEFELAPSTIRIAGVGDSSIASDASPMVIDYNLDGVQDLLLTDDGSGFTDGRGKRLKSVVLQSTGAGFTPVRTSIPAADTTTHSGHGHGNKVSKVLDVNGDGLEDVAQVVGGSLHLYIRRGKQPDVIVRVKPGVETPEAKVTYEPIGANPAVYTPGACSHPQRCSRRGMWVVSQSAMANGMPAPADALNRFSYSYTDGRMDMRGRGWLGFASQTTRDAQTGGTATTRYDNVSTKPLPSGLGYVYPFHHLPKRTEFQVKTSGDTDARTVRRVSTTVFDTMVDDSGHVRFVYPKTSTFSEEDGVVPVLVRSETTTTVPDGFGNVTSTDREVDVVSQGAATGLHHREQSGVVYSNRKADWLIGLPTDVTETSTTPSGEVGVRKTRNTYDALGRLWTSEEAPDHENDPASLDSQDVYLKTSFQHDRFGLVNLIRRTGSVSGPARIDQVSYDTLDNTFPRRSTNAAGHVSEVLYHSGLGVPARTADVNGVETTLSYDGFGRLRKRDGMDDADSFVSYSAAAFQVAGKWQSGRAVQVRTAQNPLFWKDPSQTTVFDGLGRVVRRSETQADGAVARTDIEYDRFGNVVRVSTPYFDTLAIGKVKYETTAYDNLNRPLWVARPGSPFVRSMAYEGLTTKTWDEKGSLSYTTTDALGRVEKSVNVEPGGRELPTKYTYGPFGVGKGITDAKNNITSAKFDERGRRWHLVDPDLGAETVVYNSFGDVKKTVSGAGEVTRYQVDGLGRVSSVESTDGTSTFQWDVAAHGVGQLWKAEAPGGISAEHDYDDLGRLAAVRQVVGAKVYLVSQGYDSYGRPSTLTYPAAAGRQFSVQRIYKPSGWLEELRNPNPQPAGKSYWKATSRDASGRILTEEFGNRVATTRAYTDAGLVRRIESFSGPSAMQKLVYEYDERVGLLKSRHDVLGKTTEDFEYDHLYRLTKWTAYQNCTKSITKYGYDDIGNLSTQTVLEGAGESLVNDYAAPGAGPHALKSSTSAGVATVYGYDAAGRQTVAGARTVNEYSAMSLPKRITQGALSVTFEYDAFGSRVRKSRAGGAETVYIRGVYERRSKGASRTHVYKLEAEGRVVAEVLVGEMAGAVVSTSNHYLAADNLGSTESVMNESGAVVDRLKYSPFGARRFPGALASPLTAPHGETKTGFTGHEPDDEFGLTNMRGRIYDARVGQFLTPDPLVQAPLFGQSLNRYRYALNSPTNLVDPSGFQVNRADGTRTKEDYETKIIGPPHEPPKPPPMWDGLGMWGGGGLPDGAAPTADSTDRNGNTSDGMALVVSGFDREKWVRDYTPSDPRNRGLRRLTEQNRKSYVDAMASMMMRMRARPDNLKYLGLEQYPTIRFRGVSLTTKAELEALAEEIAKPGGERFVELYLFVHAGGGMLAFNSDEEESEFSARDLTRFADLAGIHPRVIVLIGCNTEQFGVTSMVAQMSRVRTFGTSQEVHLYSYFQSGSDQMSSMYFNEGQLQSYSYNPNATHK
ncbi:MAG: RHS repeat domain-containing protein [Candidatus Geothermincolia bacterium]